MTVISVIATVSFVKQPKEETEVKLQFKNSRQSNAGSYFANSNELNQVKIQIFNRRNFNCHAHYPHFQKTTWTGEASSAA